MGWGTAQRSHSCPLGSFLLSGLLRQMGEGQGLLLGLPKILKTALTPVVHPRWGFSGGIL